MQAIGWEDVSFDCDPSTSPTRSVCLPSTPHTDPTTASDTDSETVTESEAFPAVMEGWVRVRVRVRVGVGVMIKFRISS